MKNNILIVIPARGGSKGIPGKNIKLLGGKPLICYSIDVARTLVPDEHICVTTDSDEIIKVVENYGLKVPFRRPDELATDTCGSNEVIQHAVNYFVQNGFMPNMVVLLQPTSPFRKSNHLTEAVELYNDGLDMVVSVKEAASNPYYNCFEEDSDGYLTISKFFDNFDKPIHRRQDAPKVWEYNGSIYVINPKSLMEKGMSGFSKIKKYEMDAIYSIDLDTMFDWKMAELVLKEKLLTL